LKLVQGKDLREGVCETCVDKGVRVEEKEAEEVKEVEEVNEIKELDGGDFAAGMAWSLEGRG
jgi:hypothetical protein